MMSGRASRSAGGAPREKRASLAASVLSKTKRMSQKLLVRALGSGACEGPPPQLRSSTNLDDLFKDGAGDFESSLEQAELPPPPPPPLEEEDEYEHKAEEAPVAKRRKSLASPAPLPRSAKMERLAEEEDVPEEGVAGEAAPRSRTKSIGGKKGRSARERPDVRRGSVSDGLDVHLANALAFTPTKDFSKPSARGGKGRRANNNLLL
jgi:hypothetical protein